MKPQRRRSLFGCTPLFVVAILTISIMLLNWSCEDSKIAKEIKPEVTIQNLQTAYAKAVRHGRMYSLFVKQAENEKNLKIANLYRAAVRSEDLRATMHAGLLQKSGVEPVIPPLDPIVVGKVSQTLKMAMNSETLQGDDMYPGMIKTAALEKDSAALMQFIMARDVDIRHHELFFQALNQIGEFPKAQFFVCPTCGYIFTSDKTGECPICHTSRDKFQRI